MSMILIIIMLLIPVGVNASEIDRWANPPRDVYAHTGGSATCAFGASAALRENDFKNAYIKSALGCFAIGAIKEELIDSKRSYREYGLNIIGILIGTTLSWTFEDYNFSLKWVDPDGR